MFHVERPLQEEKHGGKFHVEQRQLDFTRPAILL